MPARSLLGSVGGASTECKTRELVLSKDESKLPPPPSSFVVHPPVSSSWYFLVPWLTRRRIPTWRIVVPSELPRKTHTPGRSQPFSCSVAAESCLLTPILRSAPSMLPVVPHSTASIGLSAISK